MDIKKSFAEILKRKEENKSFLILPDVSIEIMTLPNRFSGRGEVKGFEFIQINKTNRGFLYEVRKSGHIPYYEVFMRKINKRFGCESYPSAKSFGIWAWTFKFKDKATRKLNSL
jgi:hypothetical protein